MLLQPGLTIFALAALDRMQEVLKGWHKVMAVKQKIAGIVDDITLRAESTQAEEERLEALEALQTPEPQASPLRSGRVRTALYSPSTGRRQGCSKT